MSKELSEVRVNGMLASVEVKWIVDDSPDLSYIGKYCDDCPGAIDISKFRQVESGHLGFFLSANNSKYSKKGWDHVDGKTKYKLIKKHGSLKNVTRSYAIADFKRMEAFEKGEWEMRGCSVTVRIGKTEESDSLWGIESDSEKKYMKEVEKDCTANALSKLQKLVEKKKKKRRTPA